MMDLNGIRATHRLWHLEIVL